jgi:hypothetical protein
MIRQEIEQPSTEGYEVIERLLDTSFGRHRYPCPPCVTPLGRDARSSITTIRSYAGDAALRLL